MDGELTTEECKKILASVADFCKCVIIFTGGEPMERDDIYELIRYCRELKLRPVLATCGYPINYDSITKLKDAGILALSFSLDGASAETHDRFRRTPGAFNKAIAATKAARRADMRFQINTTISKININEVAAIAKLAQELGAYCFNPFILVPTGRGEKLSDQILDPVEYEALLNDLLRLKLKSQIEVRVTCGPQFARVVEQSSAEKRFGNIEGCMGGTGFGFISYKADVQTCGFLNISAGNLVENGFDFGKIWRDSDFLKEIRDLPSYTGKCKICRFLNICKGCRARAYTISGDYLGSDPVCAYEPEAGKYESDEISKKTL